MIVNRRSSAEKIIATIKGLPKEKQIELLAIMGGFLQSSRYVFRRYIRNLRRDRQDW